MSQRPKKYSAPTKPPSQSILSPKEAENIAFLKREISKSKKPTESSMKEYEKSNSKICSKTKKKSNHKIKMIHFTLSAIWLKIYSCHKSTKSSTAQNPQPPSQIACGPWTAQNLTWIPFYKTGVILSKNTSLICPIRRKTSNQRKNWVSIWQITDGRCKQFWLKIRIWFWWGKIQVENLQRSICMQKWRIRCKMGFKNGWILSFLFKLEIMAKN